MHRAARLALAALLVMLSGCGGCGPMGYDVYTPAARLPRSLPSCDRVDAVRGLECEHRRPERRRQLDWLEVSFLRGERSKIVRWK